MTGCRVAYGLKVIHCEFAGLLQTLRPRAGNTLMSKGQPGDREFLDIEEVSAEIRERVRRLSARSPSAALPGGRGKDAGFRTVQAMPIRLPASEELWNQVAGEKLLIGRMPPSPGTVRGSVGRFLVEFVRRSLFWLTPQIQAFQRLVATALREQSGALSALAERIYELRT